jgi:hypothetical protein
MSDFDRKPSWVEVIFLFCETNPAGDRAFCETKSGGFSVFCETNPFRANLRSALWGNSRCKASAGNVAAERAVSRCVGAGFRHEGSSFSTKLTWKTRDPDVSYLHDWEKMA